MARKIKKTAVRKTKSKAKPATRPARKKAGVKKSVKKSARKPAAGKRPSAIERLENAIEVGVAELDDVAVSMGMLGAVEPRGKKLSRKKKR